MDFSHLYKPHTTYSPHVIHYFLHFFLQFTACMYMLLVCCALWRTFGLAWAWQFVTLVCVLLGCQSRSLWQHYLLRSICSFLFLTQGSNYLASPLRMTSLFMEMHSHTLTLPTKSWVVIMTWLFICWTECKFLEINVLMVSKIPPSMWPQSIVQMLI